MALALATSTACRVIVRTCSSVTVRTAGKAPDAAVQHAHAEAGTLVAATAAAEAAPSSAAAESATADDAVAHRDRVAHVAGEADVAVGGAEALGLAECDIGEPLELRLEDAPLRRLGHE